MHNYSDMREQINGNKYIQNFTLFQNFADSCLQNDPFSWFREFAPPIVKIPFFFRKNGYERGIRFGWERKGRDDIRVDPISEIWCNVNYQNH